MKRVLLAVGAGVVVAGAVVSCGNPPMPCQVDADCEEHGYCEKGILGGSCVALYESLVIRHPANGAVIGGTAQTVEVELVAYPGLTRRDPGSIPYTLRGPGGGVLAEGQLTSAGNGRYQATWTPGPEGQNGLAVSFKTLSATSQFTVDKTPPPLEVRLLPPPDSARPGGTNLTDRDTANGYSQAWRRDETLPVEIRSSAADVNVANVDVVIYGIGGDGGVGAARPAVKASALTPCDAGYCGTAQLPLWEPQMQAFRGEMVVQVLGPDQVGNVTDARSRVKVTRWKWDYDPGAGAIRTSPAIGSTGRIYFAPSNSPGRVHALTQSGAQAWPPAAIPTVASTVAVGAADGGFEPVYVGTAGATGRLLALNGADGGPLLDCGSSGDVQAGLAVGTITVGSQVETAVAMLNGPAAGTGRLAGLHLDGASCETRPGLPNSALSSSLVMKGPDVYYGDPDGFIRSLSFASVWTPKSGWPTDAGVAAHALAISGTEIIGAGNGGVSGAIYAIPEEAGPFWRIQIATEGWNPAIYGLDQILVGGNGGALHTAVVGNSATATATPIGGVSKGAPLLGKGNIVYVGAGANVLALSADTVAPQWQVDVTEAVEGSLTIDCMRDANGQAIGGKPLGVLYVPSINGHLYAFIVDSAGLDTTSAWPKYQHDPRNTGNADTNLAQFACP
jgi:hypothetical protein